MSNIDQILEIPDDQLTGDQFRAMREAANSGRQAQRDVEQGKREVAFLKAGVDTDTPFGQLLLTAYTGDLTKDAIQGYITSLQVSVGNQVPETTTVPEVTATPEEIAALQAARNIGQGQAPSPQTTAQQQDPHAVGLQRFREHLSRSGDRAAATQVYLDSLIDYLKANPGDRRLVWQGYTDYELENKVVPFL